IRFARAVGQQPEQSRRSVDPQRAPAVFQDRLYSLRFVERLLGANDVYEREFPFTIYLIEAIKAVGGAAPDDAGAVFIEGGDDAVFGRLARIVNGEFRRRFRRRLGVEAVESVTRSDPVIAGPSRQKKVDVAIEQALLFAVVDEVIAVETRQPFAGAEP